MKKCQGYSIIEVAILLCLIAVLTAIIVVCFHPAERFREVRNAQRLSAVNTILNAYLSYLVDHGTEPVSLDANPKMIGTGTEAGGCAAQATAGTADLSLLAGKYLSAIPFDPSVAGAGKEKSYYYIVRPPGGRVFFGACSPEEVDGLIPQISASR